MVPKSQYQQLNQLDSDKEHSMGEDVPFALDSLYLSAYVMKDYPHEVTSFLGAQTGFIYLVGGGGLFSKV